MLCGFAGAADRDHAWSNTAQERSDSLVPVERVRATAPQPDDPQAGGLAARFEALIARLDAASWEEREAALQDLLELSWVDLRAIEPLLDDPELSPEQHLRLERVGFEMFRRGSRAGMGIQFGMQQAGGVPIQSTVPGFDAHRVLEPGDIALRANGRPLNSRRDLQLAILASDPGDRMDLSLLRDGQVRTVSVQLGAFNDLNSNNTLAPDLLLDAWRLRRASAGDRARPLVAADLGDWEGRLARTIEPAPGPIAAAGGQARGGLDAKGDIRIRVAGRDFVLPVTIALGRGIRLGSEFDQVEVLIRELDRQRRSIQAQIARNNAALQRQPLSDAERAATAAENTRLREEMAGVQQALQQMRFVQDELIRELRVEGQP